MSVDGLAARIFSHRGEPARSYRVTRTPRLEFDQALPLLTASLLSAYHIGSRVFSVWDHNGGSDFQVRLGGTGGFPSWSPDPPRSDGRLLFPPGARAVGEGDAVTAVAPVLAKRSHWLRVGGAVADAQAAAPTGAFSLFEDHSPFLSDIGFTLLVVAVPYGAEEVRQVVDGVAHDLHLEGARGAAEQQRLKDARNARFEELSAAAVEGLWRVHAFVGTDSDARTAQVAALWSAATEARGRGRQRLAPVGRPAGLDQTLAATLPESSPLTLASPFTIGTAGLASVCRPPVTELPGVEARATNVFDVAAASVVDGVTFGRVLDSAGTPLAPLTVPMDSIGKHVFIHGATGAGKSQATRHLLTEFSRRGIPWIVIEPAKTEYARGMAERLAAIRDQLPDPALADVHVVRMGDPSATPVSLNPLQPEAGFSYQAHLDTVVDLAVAAFDADSPFPEILTQAADRVVREAGWDPSLAEPLRSVARLYPDGAGPSYPTVADLVRACHDVIAAKGYSQEVAANVRGFVDMRLATLLTGTKRSAFASGYPLSLEACLRSNVVIELEELGGESDRALFMGLFLARLAQAVRVRHRRDPRPNTVRNVVVVEEAHRLLRNPDGLPPAAARSIHAFTDLLAEVRSQGVALMVAEQIPAKIAPDVVKNTAIKCMGRTPSADDREFVGAAIGLTPEQSRQVVALRPGVFAVHSDLEDAPVLTEFPYHPELGDVPAQDPAPLADPLPAWYGSAARPGSASTADIARAAQGMEIPRWRALVELTTVAHLVHHPVPVLGRAAADNLLADSGGTIESVDALVGALVSRAVWGRSRGLGAYSPESLATEVAARVRATLSLRGAGVPDARWRGAAFQLDAVRAALRDVADEEAQHPDTDLWRSWGLEYVTVSRAAQQRRDVARLQALTADAREIAVLGTYPSLLEGAALVVGREVEIGLRELFRPFANLPQLEPMRVLLTHYAQARGPRPRSAPTAGAAPAARSATPAPRKEPS